MRARWYDAANGRFNRLDPFAGNSSDPQSFHKYAYVHGDPIQNIDPTGEFIAGAAGSVAAISMQIETLVNGLIVAGILETGGSAGLELRAAGLALIANGDLDDGWDFYKLGSAFAGQAFQAAEQFVDALEIGQLLGGISVAGFKLLGKAPQFAKRLAKRQSKIFQKLRKKTDLLNFHNKDKFLLDGKFSWKTLSKRKRGLFEDVKKNSKKKLSSSLSVRKNQQTDKGDEFSPNTITLNTKSMFTKELTNYLLPKNCITQRR